MQWQKNGVPLNVEGNPRITQLVSGSLRLDDLAVEDKGEFECYVFNAAGSASRIIKLDVRGRYFTELGRVNFGPLKFV